ncbi:MAG: tetratricopeptide repeat protein [Candidatus Eremiobacteraeota bacterium]|nr:tetratricopeptide repeat protein [Candidatus Eremiobacteraeota bacterium]
MRALLIAVLFLSTLSFAAAQGSPQPAPEPSSNGAFVRAHRGVSTSSPEAQAAFDDGLTLLYAFNPEEARQSFERALAADPHLGIADWGVAMSHGVNINTPYDAAEQRAAHAAIVQAQAHLDGSSAQERALIAAAAERFAHSEKNDADASARSYHDAMEKAALAFPQDDDIVTLAAEAAMDTDPWGYWSDNGKPQPSTLDIVHKLQAVLARNPTHIGANHFLIHVMEAAPNPDVALESARRLAGDIFEPAAEHLAHMPAHTFMRVGQYDAAGKANVRALDDFRTYLAHPHAAGHQSYYGHDCLFAVDAFMMAGEQKNAALAASRCEDAAARYAGYVAVRFRRWDDLAPFADQTPFLSGMLAANTGHEAQTQRAVQRLEASKSDTATIAAQVVRAQLFARRQKPVEEIEALQRAVALQDRLGYAEPPAWFFPIRESLGGALYRAGRYADAEQTFRADVKRNPKNPRSLFGLAKTLERQGRTAEAADVRARFAQAWQHADVSLDMATL